MGVRRGASALEWAPERACRRPPIIASLVQILKRRMPKKHERPDHDELCGKEMFYSLQGEGATSAGRPSSAALLAATFGADVRATGQRQRATSAIRISWVSMVTAGVDSTTHLRWQTRSNECGEVAVSSDS